MVKICIDIRCLSEGRRTGVEEYTLNLLTKLFEIDKENEYVLFFNSAKKPKVDFNIFTRFPNVKVNCYRYPNKLLNFLFWYFNRPKIDRLCGGADVVFFPNIIFGAVSEKAKLIATIHDLSFERYSGCFSWKRRFWHIFINPKKICRRADKIIAISGSTKNDVASFYGINPEKVKVVRSAVSEKFCVIGRNEKKLVDVKERYKLPYKFILYLGTIEPRKNIVGIIRAYGAFQKFARDADKEDLAKYTLVIAGEKGWSSKEIYAEIESSPFKDKIQIINSIPEKDKVYIYNLASLFIYPSYFEGFGFPPLEAMRCGVPVICSNSSSLPEVCGSAAIMIDPDKPDEIYRAMREILTSRELCETLVTRGIAQSKTFDWRKTAEETLRILTGRAKE